MSTFDLVGAVLVLLALLGAIATTAITRHRRRAADLEPTGCVVIVGELHVPQIRVEGGRIQSEDLDSIAEGLACRAANVAAQMHTKAMEHIVAQIAAEEAASLDADHARFTANTDRNEP